jgi:hypothetical protein
MIDISLGGLAVAVVLNSAEPAARVELTRAELTDDPRRAAMTILGEDGRDVVASFLDVSLPSAVVSDVVFVSRPRTSEDPAVCTTAETVVSLQEQFKARGGAPGLFEVLQPTGTPVKERRYFRRTRHDPSCAELPAHRADLFSAPDASIAGRGIRLLDEAVAAAGGSPSGRKFRCKMSQHRAQRCEAQALIAKYDYAIESIRPCPAQRCLEVEQPFFFGSEAVVLRLFGADKLKYVEVEHVMRPIV